MNRLARLPSRAPSSLSLWPANSRMVRRSSSVMRVLVEACALAGDAQAGLAAADRSLRTGNRAQPWRAEIRRLRSAFWHALAAKRPEERLGNGWASRMPSNPDDIPRPRHRN